MDIEVSPAGVIASADAVAAAARQLSAGGSPSAAGNVGFMLSDAISQFSSQLQQTTTQAALDTGTSAENLEASAKLMRRVDDDAETAAMTLWSRLQ